MPDIFDQAADDKSQSAQGDIFDQAATPDPDYSHPAGLNGGTAPALPAHPRADMEGSILGLHSAEPTLSKDELNRRIGSIQAEDASAEASPGMGIVKQGAGAVKGLATGLKDVYTPTAAESQSAYGSYERGIGAAPLSDDQKGEAARKTMGGAANVVSGAGTLAFGADGGSILETGAKAITGDLASKVAIGKLAAGLGIGSAASYGAGKAADAAQVSPEAKSLIQALAFFTPSLAGLAGIHVEGTDTEQGKGIAATLFAKTDPLTGKPMPNTGVQAAAGVSPEGVVGAGVKVGDGPMRAVRYGNTVPPDAAQTTATNLLNGGIDTMKQSQAADAAAQAIVNGATPEEAVAAQQPKAPPTPAQQAAAQMFPTPVIQQDHMTAAAQIIKNLPPEAQGAATLQAHDQLSQQIAQWSTFVGSDGKTYTVNSPKDANKFASQFINAEVDKHDAKVAQTQKDAQAAQQQAAKPATAGKSKLQQAQEDKRTATAKTIIEANAELPRARMVETLANQLQVNHGDAAKILTDYQTKAANDALPTIGSKEQPVVEESRKTVDAQMDALTKGDIKVVMLPDGSSYRPALPPGMKVVNVKGDAPGAGTYIYDPAKITPKTITEAAKADTHHALLGHVQSKADIAEAGLPTAVVQAAKPDGTPIQDSEVNSRQVAKQQADILQQRHPDAVVSLKPTQQVIQERLAEATHEDMAKRFEDRFDDEHYGMAIRRGSSGELTAEDGGHVPTHEELKAGYAARIRQGIEPGELGTVQDFARAIAHNKGEGREFNKPAKPKGDIFDQAAGEQVAPLPQAKGEIAENKPEQKGADHNGLAAAPSESEHKYSYGSTQHNLDSGSEASKSVDVVRGKISPEDLAGKGTDIDENHVTVRYGIQGEDTKGIREYLSKQAPFEAKLGATDTFPPTKNSDGAAVITAPVESPELHRLNAEIEKHGDFKESDFPDYKPHVTVAYVKPEAAQKYKGLKDTAGKTFTVDSVAISYRDGNHEEVKLGGSKPSTPDIFDQAEKLPKKGDAVTFKALSGKKMKGTVAFSEGAASRVKGEDGKTYRIPTKNIEATPTSHDGHATTIHTPDAKYPGKYRLVEADSLIPSHDAQSFQPNAEYPKGVQERDYTKDNAKHRVISQAQNLEPDYLLNTNPDAVNGPPITTPDGIVLGGNSRTMTVQRAYKDGKGGEAYKKALESKAAHFGFTADQVAAMRNPIVTREIAKPGTREEMERIGSALNKNMTGALTPSEKAVSAGRKITLETMDEISRLIDSAGENASIRDMLREDGVKALHLLESSGALTEREGQQYVDNGELSEAGKDFIENALLGHIVDDAKLMDSVPKSILNKLDGSLAAVTSLSAKDDEYDIIGAIRGALEQQAEIAARKTNVDTFQRQDGLLAQRDANPVVDALSRKFSEKPNAVKKALRNFAADAKDARVGQGGMFAQNDAAFEKFNDAFGTTLSEEEYVDGTARGVFEEKPAREEGSLAEGDRGLQESGAGKPAPGSEGKLDRGDGGRANSPATFRSSFFGLDVAAEGLGKAISAAANSKAADAAKAFVGDEAERVAASRDLHNGLYDLASQDTAAVLRAVQLLKQMPGTAKDEEAIYHHLEDPSLPLTETQQTILDDYLSNLIYQSQHDFQVVTEGGVPLERYVHRQVIDRNGLIDRLLEKAQSKTPTGGGIGGGRLSKAAPSAKHRSMMAIEDLKTGKRSVVSIKGGRVTLVEKGKEPKDLGPLAQRMTKIGAEAEERAAPFVEQVTELRHEIAFAKSADDAEQLKDVQDRIAELEKQFAILDDVKARVGTTSPGTPNLLGKNGGRPIYSKEATFGQRAEISKKLDELRKTEEKIKAGEQPMLRKNVLKLYRRKEALKDAEAARDHFLNELPAETFSDGAWKGPDGNLYKITQATTKEIEAQTDVRYYHNAAASVIVNYLAMDKARRAYEFLDNFKKSPEFAQYSHSMETPGAIPKGWRATQMPQLRGYFFEPHIAEVLDTYAKAAVHDPGVMEKVGNFLRNSIFFNPLIHVPNLLNHWVVERGVSSYLNPMAYPRVTRAGIKAVNAVIHQNSDFLAALDQGAPLQSQRFETKQFADLFFKKMHDELGDPESSKTKELATALGMSPVRLVKAIYDFSGKITWYTNDIAFMTSTYEKMEKGMSLKDALRETGKHIPDYRKMTRIFDNAALGTLMSNPNITMFGAYHYGALKSYGQMAKSLAGFNWQDAGTKNDKGEPTNAAGRTEAEERLHGLDTLAMAVLVLAVIYPAIDELLKMTTGNNKAQVRRAGSSTLLYNLAMLYKGEKTPVEVGESIATPAVPLKTAVELAENRDIRTGQRIYDPHAKGGVLSSQVARRLAGSIAPVDQGMQVAEGRTDWKKLMYSMVGVSFPLHGAEKIASQINAEKLASLPPTDEATIVHRVQRSRALHDAWDGDKSKLNELLKSKDYTAKEKMKLRKDSLLPPLVYETKSMSYSDILRVYDAATPEQKEQLRIPMAKKLHNLRKAGKPVPEDD